MLLPFLTAVYLLIISIASYLLVVTLRHRHLAVAKPVGLVCLNLAIISTLQAIELVGLSQERALLTSLAARSALSIVPPLWIWWIFEYQGTNAKYRGWLMLLGVEPVVFITALWSNGYHGMMYTDVVYSSYHSIVQVYLKASMWFNLHFAYLTSISFAMLIMTVYVIYQKKERRYFNLLLIGLCLGIPMLLALLHATGYLPIKLGALSMIFILAWAVSQFRLLDIFPVALHHILDDLGNGVALLDLRGDVVYSNYLATRALGLKPLAKQTIHRPLSIPNTIKACFDFAQMETQKKDIELPNSISKGVDGQQGYFVEATLTPVSTYSGEHVGSILMLHDVAQRRALEQQSLSRITQLEEYDRLKSDFFSGISHEFRTPLTISLGTTTDVIEGRYGDISRQSAVALDSVIKANHRLLLLVNQLLDLSQLDAAATPVNLVSVDLPTYLPGLLGMFESTAEQKSIKIEHHYETCGSVVIDLPSLDKIVCNLLSNAIKSIGRNGTITVTVTNPCTDWVELAIRDTGVGIDPEILPVLFERFFYHATPGSEWQPSIGIGLALVKQLVALHEGEISVQSEPGNGALFLVRLKTQANHPNQTAADIETLGQPPEPSDTLLATAADSSPSTRPVDTVLISRVSGGVPSKLLLVVEDSAQMRAYLRFHFGEEYRIMEAADGQEGLELAQQMSPDLVILDVMLPLLDGFELCKQLKGDNKTSHIPVIMLTAKNQQREKIMGLETGADDYIAKPFDMSELKHRVENLIRSWENRIELSASMQALPGKARVPIGEIRFLEKFKHAVQKRLSDADLQIEQVAHDLHMSERTLQRKLKSLTGKSPQQLIQSYRLHQAAELLKSSEDTVSRIGYRCGFANHSYFAKKFKAQFNLSPNAYRALATKSNQKQPKH